MVEDGGLTVFNPVCYLKVAGSRSLIVFVFVNVFVFCIGICICIYLCVQIENRGCVGETVFHVCFLQG